MFKDDVILSEFIYANHFDNKNIFDETVSVCQVLRNLFGQNHSLLALRKSLTK